MPVKEILRYKAGRRKAVRESNRVCSGSSSERITEKMDLLRIP
jgi:hypothetical protein